MDIVVYCQLRREVIDLIDVPARGDTVGLKDGRRYLVRRAMRTRRGAPVIVVERVPEPDSETDPDLHSRP